MIDFAELEEQIRWWLKEDVGPIDVTTWSTVAENHRSRGIIHMKQPGVVAGLPVAGKVFATVDSGLSWMPKVEDGARVEKGTVIAEVEGSTRSILKGERLALNLLQRLSGIATRTREYVDALEGMPVRLADTRKTTPGLRLLEKYAVRVGGGANHRFGLHDAVLIKDNHIKAAGGVAAAVRAAKNAVPHTMKIEVEVENLTQADEAVAAGADIIMADNMNLSDLAETVRFIKAKAPHIIVEDRKSVV